MPAQENSTPWRHTIGIVGGMGPFAHLELEKQLLVATRKLIGRAPKDQDFPEWIASSIPETPDRTKALLGEGPSPVPWLERSVRRLCSSDAGCADFAVIACNTAHAYLDELRQRVDTPILDMIEETVLAAKEKLDGKGTVGLLATTGTLQSTLYQDTFRRLAPGIRTVSLLDLEDGERLQEELVMVPIYGPKNEDGERKGGGIKSGLTREDEDEAQRALDEAAGPLKEAVKHLARAGADLCVLGCTELPLAIGREPVHGVQLLDPVEVIAEASIAIAAGDRALPGQDHAPSQAQHRAAA